MPFRFNHKDLAILACNPSIKFRKEGLLWFKEKEGKLFNKSESFSERLVRLYGNLLFYFKGKDVNSECSGVIVLERYQVISDSSKDYAFSIEFFVEDEHRYEFVADHQEDYEEWMILLKRSSHEKLSKRLQVLRSEIHSLTGKDPMQDYHANLSLDNLTMSTNRMSLFPNQMNGDDLDTDGYLIELSIGCNDLVTKDSTPCAMVQVFAAMPPHSDWMKHSQTEICEQSINPMFLRTIVFDSSYPPLTQLKFVLQDVLNVSANDVAVIGSVVCTIEEITKAPQWQLTASIKNETGSFVGNINIIGWQRRQSLKALQINPENRNDELDGGDENLLINASSYLTDVKQRFFHIPTRDDGNLKCQEILAETLLCFKIPKQLLTLLIREEKNGVVELHNIGDLHPEWNKVKEDIQNQHIDFIQQYSTILSDLSLYEGTNFKKSVDKSKKELSFVPTNLHMQGLSVINKRKEEYYYDVVTVGAPAAHALKFKHGGLKRLFSSYDEHAKKSLQSDDGGEDMRKANYIKALHIKDNLKCYSHEISHLMGVVKDEINDATHLTDNTTHISVKIGELLTMLSTGFIKECERELLKARTNGPELRIKSHVLSSGIDNDTYRDLVWEWNGSEFKPVKSSTVEPDCSVRDTLGRFMGAVNTSFNTRRVESKDVLLNMLAKLEKAVSSLIGKMNILMRFAMMQNQDNTPLNDLRIRRDIVFSQTLTPVVAGFAVMLSRKITDERFMQQIANIGLLVHFESLLTTGGDEMGMLEDMYSGHTFLKNVTFEIVSGTSSSHPELSGTRENVIVEFPVDPEVFKSLPKKLRDRGSIHLHPVLFSIGINEQATVAERFGDTSLQEAINHESLKYLQIYADGLHALDLPNDDSIIPPKVSIEKLMSQLSSTISTKKSKNYDVLLLSEEICTRMKGMRLTSCKSAKDRTSMSVSLEMVKILEREHGMKEDAFQKVLDSVRSQGTRLINSYKNVGLPKYAFNKVQVRALPPIYRPPEGTTGKYLQT